MYTDRSMTGPRTYLYWTALDIPSITFSNVDNRAIQDLAPYIYHVGTLIHQNILYQLFTLSLETTTTIMTFAAFLYSQFFVKLPYPKKSLSGQTIIVTGSNTGLGLEAARHFTRLGAAKVILAVRSLSKGEAAKESIEASTDRKGVVEVWSLDLGSYESVKEFAKKAEGLDRLDALVENAGVAKTAWSVQEDNEATITTNVVSTFLLGLLLLPKLRETGQKYNITPHLTVTCSEVHAWSPMEERKSESIFDALNNKETANMGDRYFPTCSLKIRTEFCS